VLLISVLDKNGVNKSSMFTRDPFLYRLSESYTESFLCCFHMKCANGHCDESTDGTVSS
jgi:hypothetical protein